MQTRSTNVSCSVSVGRLKTKLNLIRTRSLLKSLVMVVCCKYTKEGHIKEPVLQRYKIQTRKPNTQLQKYEVTSPLTQCTAEQCVHLCTFEFRMIYSRTRILA